MFLLSSIVLTLTAVLAADYAYSHPRVAGAWLDNALSFVHFAAVGAAMTTVLLEAFDLVCGIAIAGVIAFNVRCLNELTHMYVHRFRSTRRRLGGMRQFVLSFVTIVLRGESVQNRFRTHCVEHHPNATELQDPTARTVVECASSSRSAGELFLRLWFSEAISVLVQPMSTSFSRSSRGSGALCVSVRVCVAGLVWMYAGWAGLLAAVVFPFLVLAPAGMALSVSVEHNWAGRTLPAMAYTEFAKRRLRTETVRGFRLRVPRLLDRVLSVTLLPYGDLYHFAHSCRSDLDWAALRSVDEDLRGTVGSSLLSSSLNEQLAVTVSAYSTRAMTIGI